MKTFVLKNSETGFQKAETRFQNGETRFQKAETRFQKAKTACVPHFLCKDWDGFRTKKACM